MYRHAAAAGPISVLDGVRARLADRDEQVGNCAGAGADC
jgi:hypothetical protein